MCPHYWGALSGCAGLTQTAACEGVSWDLVHLREQKWRPSTSPHRVSHMADRRLPPGSGRRPERALLSGSPPPTSGNGRARPLCIGTRGNTAVSCALRGGNWGHRTPLSQGALSCSGSNEEKMKDLFHGLRSFRQEENFHACFWWAPGKMDLSQLRNRETSEKPWQKNICQKSKSLKEGWDDKKTQWPRPSLFFTFLIIWSFLWSPGMSESEMLC